MRSRRKRRQSVSTVPTRKDPVYNSLELLPGRTLMALIHYLDYSDDELAREMLERVFRDYRKRKTEVKDAVVSAMKYLLKGRFIPDPEYPNVVRHCTKPKKDRIKFTKRQINEIARKVWKAN